MHSSVPRPRGNEAPTRGVPPERPASTEECPRMPRAFLFIVTNLAVLLVLGIVLRLLGVDSILARHGTGLDYWNLLVFAAVFGMGGSFISLGLSKFMAKRATGAQVIEQPRSELESWLVQTVSHH